jgi:hypothetical protein
MVFLSFTAFIALLFPSLQGMEGPSITLPIEQKYTEEAHSLLTTYGIIHELMQSYYKDRNLELTYYTERFDTMKKLVQKSPRTFFLTILKLPKDDPFYTLSTSLGFLALLTDLAAGYYAELEGHFIKKTFTMLTALRQHYIRPLSLVLSRYTEEKNALLLEKIYTIDTWLHTLKEQPFSIDYILQEVEGRFSKARAVYKQYPPVTPPDIQSNDQEKILRYTLHSIGILLESLSTLHFRYLTSVMKIKILCGKKCFYPDDHTFEICNPEKNNIFDLDEQN